jgi:hypothetical protein
MPRDNITYIPNVSFHDRTDPHITLPSGLNEILGLRMGFNVSPPLRSRHKLTDGWPKLKRHN